MGTCAPAQEELVRSAVFRYSQPLVVSCSQLSAVGYWRLRVPRMNDLTAAGAFCPYFSAGFRFVVDQKLCCWDTVLTPRTAAEDGSVSSHRGFSLKGLFVERCCTASSSEESDEGRKIPQPTTAKVNRTPTPEIVTRLFNHYYRV